MAGLGNTACGNVTLNYIQTMISFTLLVYLTITMIGFMLKSPGIVFCQYIEFVIVVKHCWFSPLNCTNVYAGAHQKNHTCQPHGKFNSNLKIS